MWVGLSKSLLHTNPSKNLPSSPTDLGEIEPPTSDQEHRTMYLKHLLSRLTIRHVSKLNRVRTTSYYREICTSSHIYTRDSFTNPRNRNRFIHSSQGTVSNDGAKGVESVSVESEEDEDEAVMNDFLSRFVWIMRGKLSAVYREADKKEIDAMLQIIVGKVVAEMEGDRLESFIDMSGQEDFSEDLWTTVREVSGVVLEDMKKAKKKEKMKSFLQSEEVKEMTRFAGEIGIRGDMLRELRFKWAREKLEDSEFYESLERMRKDAMEPEPEVEYQSHERSDHAGGEGDDQVVSLPKRSGKIKYNIYGLDLSKPKWAEVAEQIHEAGGSIWPQEPKPISGKCKNVTEKIVSLQVDDDPSALIAEWIELLQPSRVDWLALLDRLKEHNHQMYLKVAELVLDEESFETNVRDYSQLVDAHAKHNQLDDVERILKKMNEKGIMPDIPMKTTMVHMYSKAGNLNLAKEAFESLRRQGFQPDIKVYSSMIMAYVNVDDPKSADFLLRELSDTKKFKPSEDLFLAVIRSYALNGDATGASRILKSMEFAGYQAGLEANTYLVEAYSRTGHHTDDARKHFDEIMKLGTKPDDKIIARMIAAYAVKNSLDKALQLLLQLEKDGIEYGLATCAVLIDWLGKLQLIDEAEDLLGKFTEKGVSPSLDVHISLCDMYARAREEKKTLQALGVVEANKDKLTQGDFERVINALIHGGFNQDGERMHALMTAWGFTASEGLNVTLKASQTFSRRRSHTK
ncbi:putative tetratricopeptide-like helical domain superfamily [Helianthus anomalus]